MHTDAYSFFAALAAGHIDGSLRPVIFDRIGKQVDQNLLHPGSIGMNKESAFELGKTHLDTAFLRLRLDHVLAFEHDCGQ